MIADEIEEQNEIMAAEFDETRHQHEELLIKHFEENYSVQLPQEYKLE